MTWDEKAASGWAEFCKFFGPNPRHKKSAQRAYGTAWLDAKDALLSDESIERAARALFYGDVDPDLDVTWATTHEGVRDEYLAMARNALAAAIG